MTVTDVLRLLIIIASLVVSWLWVSYGRITGRWLWSVVALCWLIPVLAFFSMRYVVVLPPVILNQISLSLYLMGISALGGVVLAKIKSEREKERHE